VQILMAVPIPPPINDPRINALRYSLAVLVSAPQYSQTCESSDIRRLHSNQIIGSQFNVRSKLL
jgi:hypothetical protein